MTHFELKAIPPRRRHKFICQTLAVLAGFIVLSPFDGLGSHLERQDSSSPSNSTHQHGAAIRTLHWYSEPALWHQLWIEGENGPVVNRWLSAIDLGCASGGLCSFDADLRLPPGNYIWRTRSWTAIGYSPWSLPEELGVERQYLLEPQGVVTPKSTFFRWMRMPGATWYRVVVRQEDKVLVDQWLRAVETACAEEEDVCRIAAGFDFDPGYYSWTVQPWSANAGSGVEQVEFAFEVAFLSLP